MTTRDPRADARARFEVLLAQKGGRRPAGGGAAPPASGRPAASDPGRERPAAPSKTFRRKV